MCKHRSLLNQSICLFLSLIAIFTGSFSSIESSSVFALGNTFQLVSSTSLISTNTTFTVQQRVNGTNLLAVSTNITYDQSVFAFVKEDSSGTAFKRLVVFTPSAGNLINGRITSNFAVVNSDSLITTFTFKTLKNVSQSVITTSGSGIDNKGNAVPLTTANLTLTTPVSRQPASSKPNSVRSDPTQKTAPTITSDSGQQNTNNAANQNQQQSPTTTSLTSQPDNKPAAVDPQVKAITDKLAITQQQKARSDSKSYKPLLFLIGTLIGLGLLVVGFLYFLSRRRAGGMSAEDELVAQANALPPQPMKQAGVTTSETGELFVAPSTSSGSIVTPGVPETPAAVQATGSLAPVAPEPPAAFAQTPPLQPTPPPTPTPSFEPQTVAMPPQPQVVQPQVVTPAAQPVVQPASPAVSPTQPVVPNTMPGTTYVGSQAPVNAIPTPPAAPANPTVAPMPPAGTVGTNGTPTPQ